MLKALAPRPALLPASYAPLPLPLLLLSITREVTTVLLPAPLPPYRLLAPGDPNEPPSPVPLLLLVSIERVVTAVVLLPAAPAPAVEPPPRPLLVPLRALDALAPYVSAGAFDEE